LIIFGLAESAIAECVDSFSSDNLIQQATVVSIDANNGCDDIANQEGCSIKNPDVGSTCSFDNGEKRFTVKVDDIGQLGLRWSLIQENNASNVEIDTAIIGGGSTGKNNCAAFHPFDVTSGSGGDCKNRDGENGPCISYQNITSLDVCSDLRQEDPPPAAPVAETLPNCQPDPPELGLLDSTGIQCPPGGDPVVVCNLEKGKKDWGTTDGTDICCQCNITDVQKACFVTLENRDNDECQTTMTVDPTQSVELMFFRDDTDPCVWSRTAQGWKKICWNE
jgi:hypothetical protein